MTPKQQFLKLPYAKAFADIAVSPDFQSTLNFALLQFVANQKGTANPSQAWDEHSRLCGAKDFIAVLQGLADMAPPKKPLTEPQLNEQP